MSVGFAIRAWISVVLVQMVVSILLVVLLMISGGGVR